MQNIKEAKFQRITELNDKKYAEVMVVTAGRDKPVMALFEQSADGGLQMSKLYHLDVDYELDWYENNLHQAYTDITDNFFDHGYAETNGLKKDTFADEVLSYGNIREEAEKGLRQG